MIEGLGLLVGAMIGAMIGIGLGIVIIVLVGVWLSSQQYRDSVSIKKRPGHRG